MRRSKQKQSKTWIQSKFSLVGGIIILSFLVLNFTNTWKQNQAVDTEIDDLEEQILTLETTNVELSELINYLNSTAYIEKKARQDLGLKKEGEKTVVIPDVSGLVSAKMNQDKKRQGAQVSNPVSWWRYFFDK